MSGPAWLRDLPRWTAGAIIGAVSVGLAGAVAGLVIGLRVYPPTAWFATLELGLPAAILGALAGTLVGGLLGGFRHPRTGDRPAGRP
jgi:hypothetical protein